MQKEEIKKITFYLYNYNNIDNLINERKTNIIDSINVTHNNWLRSKTQESNTLENQVIKLSEDTVIIEYKKWQVFIKKILVFLCKKSPISYQYLILKFFKKLENKEIMKRLRIDSKELIFIKSKLLKLIYKNAKLRNLV